MRVRRSRLRLSLRSVALDGFTSVALAAGLVGLVGCGDNLFDAPVAISEPKIEELVAPDSVEVGTLLEFSVVATSDRKITQVHFELSGAVESDTIYEVAEPDVEVTVAASYEIPAVVSSSTVVIRATATDGGGFDSEVRSDTVTVWDPAAAAAAVAPLDAVLPGSSPAFTEKPRSFE